MGMAVVTFAGVAILPHMVEVIVPLEQAVVRDDPVIGVRDEGAKHRRRDFAVIVRRDGRILVLHTRGHGPGDVVLAPCEDGGGGLGLDLDLGLVGGGYEYISRVFSRACQTPSGSGPDADAVARV